MQPRSLVAGRDLTSEGSGAFACLVKHGKDTFVAVWAYPTLPRIRAKPETRRMPVNERNTGRGPNAESYLGTDDPCKASISGF